MADIVKVIGIFTKDSRSSSTAQERGARLREDIAHANEVWGNCQINFVFGDTYNYTDRTINASSVNSSDNNSAVDRLIEEVKARRNQETAIYVVYLSGDYFSDDHTIGVGGPLVFNKTSDTNYNEVGHIGLTNIAGSSDSPYSFAHEAGHVLFGRYVNNTFTINDPSTGKFHNDNSRNIMYSPVPETTPLVNASQCQIAKQSRVILNN
ncbi:hypothetical protein [Priestia megaterium]|uniref:hypothetical protein n=1 Tax=Priestia megaterium TaxID=1404 RepID=UPI003D2E1E6F